MFVYNRKGADLQPGLITATAALALGFVSKFGAGIKGPGETVNTASGNMTNTLNTAANSIP